MGISHKARQKNDVQDFNAIAYRFPGALHQRAAWPEHGRIHF